MRYWYPSGDVRPNGAAQREKKQVDSEQDYIKTRQDGGPDLEGGGLKAHRTASSLGGVDSFGLKHLNCADTFLN